MRILAILLCGLVLSGVSGQEKKKAGDKEKDKKTETKPSGKPDPRLEGAWMVVSVEVEGKPWPAEKTKGMHAIFNGEELSIKRAKQTLGQGRYSANVDARPAHLDYRESNDVYSVYDTGIYQVEDDTLRWCTTADRKKRPSNFDSKEGMLLVLKRQPKADGQK